MFTVGVFVVVWFCCFFWLLIAEFVVIVCWRWSNFGVDFFWFVYVGSAVYFFVLIFVLLFAGVGDFLCVCVKLFCLC